MDPNPSENPLGQPRRRPAAPRRKRIADMTILEAEEYLAGIEAEIADADCGRCRRNKLNAQIGRAKAHIVRLRRANMLAEAEDAR